MSFGKGGAQRIPPFGKTDEEQLIGPLRDLIGGQVPSINIGNIQDAIRTPNQLETGAASILTGPVGAESFLQGGQGALGTAGGLFGQAQQAAQADVLNDPVTQRLLQAQTGAAQSFLNKNLGEIGASAQRASGGLGSGSGETAAKTRATSQTAGALAGQQAQTLQAARDFQLRQAGALGGLGGGLGQLGLGQAGLGQGLLGQQIGLGGQFQGREAAAQLFPLEQIFRLGELLKSTSGVRQPGFLEQAGSFLSGAGSAAKGAAGVAGLAALSDQESKEDLYPAQEQIQEFLDGLVAYNFRYKTDPKRHVGIMAQDAERSELGRGFIVDTPEGKMIHLGLGFGAVLASLAEINKRLTKLEGSNGKA